MANGVRWFDPVPLDDPSHVIGPAECEQCSAQLLNGVESPRHKEAFFNLPMKRSVLPFLFGYLRKGG